MDRNRIPTSKPHRKPEWMPHPLNRMETEEDLHAERIAIACIVASSSVTHAELISDWTPGMLAVH